jgi:hypothetical protein
MDGKIWAEILNERRKKNLIRSRSQWKDTTAVYLKEKWCEDVD